jgi:gas vesicle protein
MALVLLGRVLEASMNERTEYWTWLSCFLAGGIAGAGAALLLAPGSGRDTRGRMGRRLRRAARSARELKDRTMRHGSVLPDNGGARVKASDDAAPSI